MNPAPIINVNFKARGKKKTINVSPQPKKVDSYDDDVFNNVLRELNDKMTSEEVGDEENLNDR